MSEAGRLGRLDHADDETGAVMDTGERSWLPRHSRGEQGAFGELMNAYRAAVYGYLVRCGIEPAARDDVFQDIFMKIHAAAHAYQPSRPLKPWLFTIAANTVRNHFRKRRIREAGLRDEVRAEPPSAEAGPDRIAEARQDLGWLETAVAALPLPQREVVVLSCVEQMNQNEVAAALQIPVNTVKTHLRQARLTLARERARRQAGGIQ